MALLGGLSLTNTKERTMRRGRLSSTFTSPGKKRVIPKFQNAVIDAMIGFTGKKGSWPDIEIH